MQLEKCNTPLQFAARKGHTACVECLLSTPHIDVESGFQTIFFFSTKFNHLWIYNNDIKMLEVICACTIRITSTLVKLQLLNG